MGDTGSLVLGAAVGLHEPDVRVFVESLRRHYTGDVILLVGKSDMAMVEYLIRARVMPVFFDSAYWMLCHILLGRFIRYGDLLRQMSRQYQRILLTDVSDVLFQAHPFENLPSGSLLCFMEKEGLRVGDDPSNRGWVEQVFGASGLERIAGKPVACAGTTIGTHAALLDYIDRMLARLSPEILLPLRNYRGHEQGILNYLLHTGELPGAVKVPNGGHVLTMGLMRPDEFDVTPDGKILAFGGRLCPIVHQYTYHGHAKSAVRKAFGLAG